MSFLIGVQAADADIIHPVGLADGMQYRFAFVSSGTVDGTSSSIDFYDDFVQGLAVAADPTGLGSVEWRAIVSTSSVSAASHLGTSEIGIWDGSSVPIYLVNTNSLVANDFADLWDGSINTSINKTENGAPPPLHLGSPVVWSGSDGDGSLGTAGPIEGNVVMGKSVVRYGRFQGSFGSGQWLADSNVGTPQNYPVYGLSNVITVGNSATAVPEPSSWALMTLAGFGLGLYQFRRRVKYKVRCD